MEDHGCGQHGQRGQPASEQSNLWKFNLPAHVFEALTPCCGPFVGRVVSLLDLELCLSWTRVYLLVDDFEITFQDR